MLDFLFNLSIEEVVFMNLAFIVVNIGFSFVARMLVKKKYNKAQSIEKALYLEQKLMRYVQFPLIILTAFFTSLTICPHIPKSIGDKGVFIVMGIAIVEMFIIIIANMIIFYDVNKSLRNTTTTIKETTINILKGIVFGVVPVLIMFGVLMLLDNVNMDKEFKKYIKPAAIILIYMMISVIMPFFLKYIIKTSAMDGEYKDLKDELSHFLSKAGLKNVDIKLWKTKSDRHANALVSGFIKKEVFISDYLIDNFTLDEIKGVLAHEVGHIKKHHLWIRSLLIIILLIIFPLIGKGFDLYEEHFSEIPIWVGISIFAVVFIGYFIFFRQYIIRMQERQADAFVLNMGVDGKVYISALYKLARLNNAVLKPNKLDEKFHTHPSMAKRIRWIMQKADISENDIIFED